MIKERFTNTEIRSYDSDGIINGLEKEIRLTLDVDRRETRRIKNLKAVLQVEKALKIQRDFEKKHNFQGKPYYKVIQVGFKEDGENVLLLFNPNSLAWESNFTDKIDEKVSGSSARDALNNLLVSFPVVKLDKLD